MDPDTPPQNFSILNMMAIMQELFDNQLEEMDINGIKKDLKSIKSQLPHLKEDLQLTLALYNTLSIL